jgi:Ca2+-binding EF-hand superfamily protein
MVSTRWRTNFCFIETGKKPSEEDEEDADVMSHLNYRKLQKIKEDFMRCQEKGLSLEQFIKVMLVNIKKSRDRPGLVKNLIELFRQIDVNND